MGYGVLARLTPVALRRWCTLVAAVCCGVFVVSINHETGLAVVTDDSACYSARLCYGELWLRWNRQCPAELRPWDGGLTLIWSNLSVCSLPWRPYHAHSTGYPPSDFESLNIPLWHAAAASLIVLGYAHGLVRGLRRVDRCRCHVCGVDLVGRGPAEACPSCGAKPSIRAGLSCRACGYDLAGIAPGWGGRCKCPECGGTTLRPAR